MGPGRARHRGLPGPRATLRARRGRRPAIDRVIGVDVVPPRGDIGDVSFVRADIRNPVIAKVIAKEDVDTVVHMSVIATPGRAGGRGTMKELNVIGTMQLLAACQKAPDGRAPGREVDHDRLRREHAATRRCSPRTWSPSGCPRSGYAKDVVEIEGYVRGFARRRPDVDVTLLRAANVVGPHVDQPADRYFRLPVIPTVLGFDPRLQFLHEDDLLRGAAPRGDHRHPRHLQRRRRRPADAVARPYAASAAPSVSLPRFAVGRLGAALRSARIADFSPEQLAFLTYGRGVDTTRMRTQLGFEPTYTTAEAFADFVPARPVAHRPALACDRQPASLRPARRSAVADAEIIPIGTRGRPGRGTGQRRPSSAARNLAPAPGSRRQEAGRQEAARTKPRPTEGRAQHAAPSPGRADGSPSRPGDPAPTTDRRAAAPRPASPSATGWRLLQGAAARGLRRRLGAPAGRAAWPSCAAGSTGDYEVDEYGFDRELTERFFMAALRPIAEKWFRVEVRGIENIPAEGGALVVSNHSGTVPLDGLMTMLADPRRDRPVPAAARRRPGLPAAVRQLAGPQGRRHPGLQRGRRADAVAAASSSASGPRASRASASRSPSATSCSASAAAASCRPRCAPACRSSRSRSSAPRRSTRWSATCRRWPGCSACPTSRSRRSSRCSARSAWCRCRRSGCWSSASRSAPTRYDAGAADDPMLVFNVTDQVRETIQQTLYSLLMQRAVGLPLTARPGVGSGQQSAGRRRRACRR